MKTLPFGAHRVSELWVSHKSGLFSHKTVTCKKQHYGEFRKYKNGIVIYWAKREPWEVVRKRNAWAIDKATFSLMPVFCAKLIGVMVTNGDRYLMRCEDFARLAETWDYNDHIGESPGAKGRLGAIQWTVPLPEWKQRPGLENEAEDRMMIRKAWK